jgi:hypothetical protein
MSDFTALRSVALKVTGLLPGGSRSVALNVMALIYYP